MNNYETVREARRLANLAVAALTEALILLDPTRVPTTADRKRAATRETVAAEHLEAAFALIVPPAIKSLLAPPSQGRCPRCGFVTADVFNCPTCIARAKGEADPVFAVTLTPERP